MKIGPYEVDRELGRGGAGIVYAGRDPGGVPVAIKVLRGPPRPEAAARFERERRLLATLTEAEGFVPLWDAGATPSGPYLVMPLLPGGTLRDRLHRGPLSPDEAIALVRPLAEAMGRAHARGIVHRDLKPENVLFTADGRPLVADLGLGKCFDGGAPGAGASAALSRTGELRGTASYMPPEQATDAKSVGPASDVFSLGAILYECLAGASPFDGGTMLEVFSRIAAHAFVPIERACPGVPDELAAALRTALARDPADRFPDGAALARALTGAARPPRRRRQALAVGAAAALVVAGTALGLERWARARAEREALREEVARRAAAESARALAIAEARALLAAGTPAPSLEAARRATELLPTSAQAWWLLSGAARGQGLADEALAAAERTVALDSRWAPGYTRRARERALRDDLTGALADSERAVALASDSSEALFGLGDALSQKGEHRRAAEIYSRGLDRDPRAVGARLNRGVAHERSGALAFAIADFDDVLAERPGDLLALQNRGGARARSGDLAGAIADFDALLALTPDDQRALRGRAFARAALGDLRAAIADFDRAIALGPEDPRCFSGRGDARERLDDLDGALSDYTRWVQLAPREPVAYFQRAFVLSRKGDLRRAVEDYTRGLALDPRSATGLANRGLALGQLEGYAAALPDLDAALVLTPDDTQVLVLRAEARAGSGDAAGAIEDYRRFLALAPPDERTAQVRAELARLGGAP